MGRKKDKAAAAAALASKRAASASALAFRVEAAPAESVPQVPNCPNDVAHLGLIPGVKLISPTAPTPSVESVSAVGEYPISLPSHLPEQLIRFNDGDLALVVEDEGDVWRLNSGRIAKKASENEAWHWATRARQCHCFAYIFLDAAPILFVSADADGEQSRVVVAQAFGVRRTDIKYASERGCCRIFGCSSSKLSVLKPPAGVCILIDPKLTKFTANKRDDADELLLQIAPLLTKSSGFSVELTAHRLQAISGAISAQPLSCQRLLIEQVQRACKLTPPFVVEVCCVDCEARCYSSGTGCNMLQPFKCENCRGRGGANTDLMCNVMRCANNVAAAELAGVKLSWRAKCACTNLLLRAVRTGSATLTISMLSVLSDQTVEKVPESTTVVLHADGQQMLCTRSTCDGCCVACRWATNTSVYWKVVLGVVCLDCCAPCFPEPRLRRSIGCFTANNGPETDPLSLSLHQSRSSCTIWPASHEKPQYAMSQTSSKWLHSLLPP